MKFLADENFDNKIVRGILRRNPDIDIVNVRDIGLDGEDDPTVLAWASQNNRILLTHDVSTITHYAYELVATGQAMTGVIEVTFDAPIGKVIDDILLIFACSLEGELDGQIYYLPL